MRPVRFALVGATGLVGRTTLDVLEEWEIPLQSLRLIASSESVGKVMRFRGKELPVEPLREVPSDIDVAIFALSRMHSQDWCPRFRDAGIVVIDHSSCFRMNPEVPLVIPEINGHALRNHQGLIANPNCTASIALLPLAAIDRVFGLQTVVLDSYQSVSGSGQEALSELEAQLHDDALPPRVYPRPIAHNVIPQVGRFDENGLCDEELKIVEETRKILERPNLTVFATTVRVPVKVGHAVSVTAELTRGGSHCEVEASFQVMPGLKYEAEDYRTPREIAGRQDVFVSRLRLHPQRRNWIQFWVVGDNLRKGAASNAVQILMELFRE